MYYYYISIVLMDLNLFLFAWDRLSCFMHKRKHQYKAKSRNKHVLLQRDWSKAKTRHGLLSWDFDLLAGSSHLKAYILFVVRRLQNL